MIVRVNNAERGVSLTEVLVALFILSVLGVVIVSGVFTMVKSNETSRNHTSAESLVFSELEYVSSQSYVTTDWTYTLPEGPYPTWWATVHTSLPSGYDGYSVQVSATSGASLPGYGSSDIQKITAVARYNGVDIFTITTYRAQ